MKFGILLSSLFLLPQLAWGEDIGFSYQSTDGTIYTSTTAPAYCRLYYIPLKEGGRTPGSMPYVCANPMFTTSRGSLKTTKRGTTDVADLSDSDESSGKKGGRFEARIPPVPKVREKHWWEWRSDPDEPLHSDRYDNDRETPPANIGRSRKRVEKEIVLTPVTEGEDGLDDFGKKMARPKAKVPPAPRVVRIEKESGDDPGANEQDGSGIGQFGSKKDGKIIPRRPPVPRQAEVLPPDSDQGLDNGKKETLPKPRVVVPPRRVAVPVAPPSDFVGDGDDGSSKFDGKGKKGDRLVARVPPVPTAPSRLPIFHNDNSDVDIQALRNRLQPITVIPPSGNVKPRVYTFDNHTYTISADGTQCFDKELAKDVIPNQPLMKDLGRKIAEQNPVPRLVADKKLLAEISKRTPAQEQCVGDAPKSPSRIVLAFDSFASFDYVDYYQKQGKELNEKELDAFKKGSAISQKVREEGRDIPGYHWKYYPKENTETEELSPAVRCAFELATKPYKNKQGQIVYNTISLVAHSFGADAVSKVASTLNKLGVKVDLVLTTDPRQSVNALNRVTFQKSPTGVARWVNFYERNDPILAGFPVDGAENVNISEGGAWHGQAPQDALVRARSSKEVMGLPRCKSDLNASVYQEKISCD
ncbi:MAG: hypothetical protein ACXWQO_13415 [Bdellovibrionota bacterium]